MVKIKNIIAAKLILITAITFFPIIATSNNFKLLNTFVNDEVSKKNQWKNFGEPFDNFMGILAFSNLPNGGGGKYQCTELVHRFVSDVYGLPSRIGIGLGHAKDLAENISVRFAGFDGSSKYLGKLKVRLKFYKNGQTNRLPVVGTIISFHAGLYGHVAVIRRIEKSSENDYRGYLFEQHGELSFKVGEDKPIRFVTFRKTRNGFWQAARAVGWSSPIVISN